MNKINKLMIFSLVCLVWQMGFVCGLSDPINQTLTEYSNLTRADNFVEVAQEMNVWIDGLFGIGLLLILGFVLFGLSTFFTPSISTQLLFTSAFLSIIAVLLRGINLISDLPFYMILSVTLISVALKIISR